MCCVYVALSECVNKKADEEAAFNECEWVGGPRRVQMVMCFHFVHVCAVCVCAGATVECV